MAEYPRERLRPPRPLSICETYEGAKPDFVAWLWLGDHSAGGHAYRGRTTEANELRIPMAWLPTHAAGTQPLVLRKDGPGRLYYRIGMRYSPTDLQVPALDRGFTISRIYEAVDRPDNVQLDEEEIWRIPLGARVRVRLTIAAPRMRYHVALVDPLPAGFEPLNPAVAGTGELPKDPKADDAGVW